MRCIKAKVYGIVQGVGFRPTVDIHAKKHNIRGSVCNKGPFVEIIAMASDEDIDNFLYDVEFNPPKRAVILKIDVEDINASEQYKEFSIIASKKVSGEIFVSPDIAICDECKNELYDKSNRRYLHPFINCTSCGPRLTILDGMPYDRIRTSMSEFPMCKECEFEYTHEQSRRYDAQPVCCNNCGPKVYILPKDAKLPVDVDSLDESLKDREAIIKVRRVIKDGGIAAIKGIGGFHLCCDATSDDAVRKLRRLKNRPAKPFAVMMRNIEAVLDKCVVNNEQRQILCGHQKPILILQKKENIDTNLSSYLAPDNPTLGVMLPYAPVQMLLFDYDDGVDMPDTLVMTSGNISGAPICRDDTDALMQIKDFCDVILSHNRLIRIRADDSVMDFLDDKPYMIRRSRGYAPLPFMSDIKSPDVLAVGGELKNSFCIGKGRLMYLSPYIGDMGDLRTIKALSESVNRMENLLEADPKIVACDMHPGYNTTMFAKELNLPIIEVQHHYAHILSCMAENEYYNKVIGISFDGTGYGTDKTIWGAEILISDLDGFIRAGHIKPFKQLGGDMSAKEGWRIAVSMIYSLYDKDKAKDIIKKLNLCDDDELKMQIMMYEKNINAITSTSGGRLFDAISAILGIRRISTFEGEASQTLTYRALQADKEPDMKADYSLIESLDNQVILNTDKLTDEIINRFLNGENKDTLAMLFHIRLSDMISKATKIISKREKIYTAALSGGVFQNKILTSMCKERLTKNNINVITHSMVPPNDGGIALGQALAAMRLLSKKE